MILLFIWHSQQLLHPVLSTPSPTPCVEPVEQQAHRCYLKSASEELEVSVVTNVLMDELFPEQMFITSVSNINLKTKVTCMKGRCPLFLNIKTKTNKKKQLKQCSKVVPGGISYCLYVWFQLSHPGLGEIWWLKCLSSSCLLALDENTLPWILDQYWESFLVVHVYA